MIKLDINDRAFKAIKEHKKTVEIRVNKNNSSKDYSKITVETLIEFSNSIDEKIICKVIKNIWYSSIEELLITEGTKFTLSSTDDFNEGVKSINNINGYKEGIKKNGVFAIHIELQ